MSQQEDGPRECLKCGYVSRNDEIRAREEDESAALKDRCPECGARYADR